MLFAERINLKIMNTFFQQKASTRWTWQDPNGETKNNIDSIHTGILNTIRDVTAVFNKFKSSDYKIVRCKVTIDRKRKCEKLLKIKKPNILSQRKF